jgi:tRNA/tmRNA/rRNA uracil-C5-methylase (TrmA/RlmC/RlmD family)
VAASAHEALARVAGPWDAIALDPPRTGAAEAIEGILRAAPRTIVYVSCDVATLARDAAKIVAAGYRVTRADAFDLFPNTHHVEAVAALRR